MLEVLALLKPSSSDKYEFVAWIWTFEVVPAICIGKSKEIRFFLTIFAASLTKSTDDCEWLNPSECHVCICDARTEERIGQPVSRHKSVDVSLLMCNHLSPRILSSEDNSTY